MDRLLVTTVLEHHGDLDPIVDVLVRRRPRLSRLLLGAVSFPDFERGSYTPADLDRDGSSWRLSLSSPAQLLTSLPSLTELVLHTSDLDDCWTGAIAAPSLRRLVIRTSASERTMAALGRLDAPALETLEIWNPDLAYGWDGKAACLSPLLDNDSGTPALRHLALVTDLGDALVDLLADSKLLPRLAVLDLSHGTLGHSGASRMLERWAAFAHLRRLVLTGNGIDPDQSSILCRASHAVLSGWQRAADAGDSIHRCSPPPISILDSLLAGWHAGAWHPD